MGRPIGTIEQMREVAQKRGGKCISDKYTSTFTKLKWQCAKNHVWEATPTHIKHSQSWCPECAGTKKLTIRLMKELAIKMGGVCLSDCYVNQKTKLEWQCEKGHRFWMAPGNVKNQNQWCLKCNGYEKGTIEEIRQIAETRGGKCLSGEYKNKEIKLEWQCAKGHTWWAKSGDIKRGHWCGECCRGFGEKICRAYFESIFDRKFPNLKPKWIRNSRGHLLQLDGYCEELKLAFEYQGHQHYLPTHFHRNKEEFEMRKEDDNLKKKLCEKQGVFLIEIPYTVKHEQIYEFIIQECERKKISIPVHKKYSLLDLRLYLPTEKIDEMRAIAVAHGGNCLSEKYLGNHEKLQWVCKYGHTWWAQPYSVKAGHWCGACAGKKKLTIEEMQEIAMHRGGRCLSKQYEGGKVKLEWQCRQEHEWSAIPNSIKRGRWCPVCAKENPNYKIFLSPFGSKGAIPAVL